MPANIKKTIIKIEAIESKPLPDGKDRYSIKAEKKGYFSLFKTDFNNKPTEGIELIDEGATLQIDYIEKANPKNPKYPFKTIVAVYPLDENSQFSFSKTPDKTKFLEEWKEIKRKVDELWQEHEFNQIEPEV